MKICFVHTPVPELKDDRLDPPVGLLYLATVLRRYGEDVSVVDLSGSPESSWENQLPVAELYGFSTYTASYKTTVKIKNMSKRVNPNAITVAGGPHATACPDAVRREFDYVVKGEGERAMLGISSGVLPKGVVDGAPVGYLDELPYPDYTLVDIHSYDREFEGKFAFPIFSSRGCPFRCAFCSAHIMSNGVGLRRRSPANTVGEINALCEKYGDVSFRFKDDLFATSLAWLREFADLAPDIEYSCNLRGNCKPESLDLLAATGCKWVCIGAESGDDLVLRAMNKSLRSSQTERVVKEAKSRGMKVLGWFIVGFPGETWESVKRTTGFIKRANFDKVVVYPLIPYPGTPVGDNAEDYELRVIDSDYSHFFYIRGDYESGFVYEADGLSPELVREMRRYVIENVGDLG